MDVFLPSRVILECFTYLVMGAHEAFANHFSQLGYHE